MKTDCAVSDYSFAHEVSHLVGGRHDDDPSASPRPYAHGYVIKKNCWETVMAINEATPDRVPYWSNLNNTYTNECNGIMYDNLPMRTSSWNNVTRVWNERAGVDAGFRVLNAADFISTTLPSCEQPGNNVVGDMTWKNIGDVAWTKAASYKLGSKDNPANQYDYETTWELLGSESIEPDESKTFSVLLPYSGSPSGSFDFWYQMKKGNDFFVELYEHSITFTTFCLPSPLVSANPISGLQEKTSSDEARVESANIQAETVINEMIEPRLVSFINDPVYEAELGLRLDDPAKAQFLMPEKTQRTSDFQIFVQQQSNDVISIRLTAPATKAVTPDLALGVSLIRIPLSLTAGVGRDELKIDVVKLIYTSINRGKVVVVDKGVIANQSATVSSLLSASQGQDVTGFQELPGEFSLNQNYPNPFNPSTTISFQVPEKDGLQAIPATLKIYDVRGRLVKTLIDKNLEPGSYSVHWDGTNNNAEKVGSGTYFYAIKAGAFRETKKMIILK